MKRRSFLASASLAAAGLFATSSKSQPASETTQPDSNPLRFRPDGSFKILVISDTHYYPHPDKYGIALTEFLIDTEKPDAVIITGDVITGNASNLPDEVKQAIANVAEAFEKKQTSWAITLGNHDREAIRKNKVTMEEQMAMYESYPHNLNAGWVRDINGYGNKNLQVWSSDGAKPLFNLWLIDSSDGSDRSRQERASGGDPSHGWIATDQVNWYRETSIQLEKRHGAKIPGAMFFHIPIPEFKEMVASNKIIGERKEPEMTQRVNGGLFSACMERGDVKAIFCGHDHENNYFGHYHGIALAYAGIAGYFAYPTIPPTEPVNGRARGGRVIELNADKPDTFKTWLRFRDGSVNWESQSAEYEQDLTGETRTGHFWMP